MEKFLVDLYHEEQEKIASAELDGFLREQSTDDLESLLGIQKVAVSGPAEPPMPTALPGGKLDKKQKLVDDFSAKQRGETPPTREQSEVVSHSNHDGPAKTAAAKEEKKRPGIMSRVRSLHENVPAQMGIQGTLGGVAGGMLGHRFGRGPLATVGGALGGGALGAGVGYLGAKGNKALYDRIIGKREKNSEGVGDGGGIGTEQGAEQGIETTASMKAKIAARALRATRGAPEPMRKIAAVVAGQQIAKLAK